MPAPISQRHREFVTAPSTRDGGCTACMQVATRRALDEGASTPAVDAVVACSPCSTLAM